MAAYTIVATGKSSSVDVDVTIKFGSGTIAVEIDDVPQANLVSEAHTIIPLLEGEVLELICSDWDAVEEIDMALNTFLLMDVSGWQLPTGLIDLRLNSTEVSGAINGWTLPAGLVHMNVCYTDVSGDISGWTLPASLETLWLNSTDVVGDISGWSLPAGLIYFRVSQTNLSGSVAGWAIPTTLEQLWLSITNVSGDVSGWDLSNSLKVFRLTSSDVSGDVSGWTFGSAMEDFYVGKTNITGDISGWTIPASMDHIGVYDTSVSGDISSWTLHAGTDDVLCYKTSIDYDSTGGALVDISNESISIRFDDCALTSQQVNNVLADLVASGLENGSMNLGGTNEGNTPHAEEDLALLVARGWSLGTNEQTPTVSLAGDVSDSSNVSGTLDIESDLISSAVVSSGVSGAMFVSSSAISTRGSLAVVSSVVGLLNSQQSLIGSIAEVFDAFGTFSFMLTGSITEIAGAVCFLDSQPGFGSSSITEISGATASLGVLDILTDLVGVITNIPNTIGSVDSQPNAVSSVTVSSGTSGDLDILYHLRQNVAAKKWYDMLQRKGIDATARVYPDASFNPSNNKTTLSHTVDFSLKIVPPYRNREGYKPAEFITSGKGLTGIANYNLRFDVKAGLKLIIGSASKEWTVTGITEIKDRTGILLYTVEIEAGD